MKGITYDKSRVINFSDAVFSIAMTLLVLEIDIPNYGAVNKHGTLGILQYRIPSFIGVLVSSLVTVIYWTAHLRIMKHVTMVDSKLLWINIALLISIVMLPFSTAFYVGSFDFSGPFTFYALNITVIGFFNLLMILYVHKTEKNISQENLIYIKRDKAMSFNGLFWWIAAAALAVFLPLTARFLFVFIFVIQVFINRHFSKQMDILNTLESSEEE